jgi:nucleotide-binding universal stress UspA family protein
MNRFRNILLVFQPPNDSVFDRAFQLAKRNQARIKIIDVVEDTGAYRGLASLNSEEELMELLRQARRQEIESALSRWREDFPDIEVRVSFGEPAVEIIREVIRGDHDLVVKTAEGRYGIRAALFGATGMKLLRKCPRPVWIIKPEAAFHGRRVLAAVNVFEDDENHRALNRMIVELGRSLASTPDGHLDIVYCWQLPGETILSSGRTRIEREELDRMLAVTERFHRNKLEDLTRSFDLSAVSHQPLLLKGDPGWVIPEFARDAGSDVLVMGTVGRSGLKGLITGNTAEKVINQIDCSVMALKPPGFVCPVK